MAEVADDDAAALCDEEFLLPRLPKTPPNTAAAMMTMATGIPNFTHLLIVLLGGRWGVM